MQPIDVRTAAAPVTELPGVHEDHQGRSLENDVRPTLESLASKLHLPLALLSRGAGGWRFEIEAFPAAKGEQTNGGDNFATPLLERTADMDALSGLPIGEARGLEWTLVVPGKPEAWRQGDDYERLAAAAREVRRVLTQHGRSDSIEGGVYGFARRLSRTAHPVRIHALVLKTMARRTGARVGALAIYNEQERALAITATHGYPSVLVEHVRIAPGEGILGSSFMRGLPEIAEASNRRRPRYRTNSYMVVPLCGPTGPVGVVALTDKIDDQPFNRADLKRARVLAAVAELGLAREAAHTGMAEVTRLAAVDPVTGLFTRRIFEERLGAEVQRAHRHQEPLALLLVDIDDFKQVNDKFGHLEGDRALRGVGDVFRDAVRIFDVCARLGGDEFVILMPRATMNVALRIAERVRERVQRRFESEPFGLTISIGAASLGPAGRPQDLIADADRRLRAAKMKGKNAIDVSD
jgi:diguanylate cyclase (GGDEF)-like protein